jgi:hypothetical protein
MQLERAFSVFGFLAVFVKLLNSITDGRESHVTLAVAAREALQR